MSDLIETLLPKAELVTYYELTIDAPPAEAYRAARAVPMMRSGVSRRLLWVRALPALMDRKASAENTESFLLLREEAGREVVWGLAGSFWHPSRNITRLPDARAWLRYSQAGSAKAAINYRVEPAEGGQSRLSTETRVACYGLRAKLLFRFYWLLVGPFSGWIRRGWLREVQKAATTVSKESR